MSEYSENFEEDHENFDQHQVGDTKLEEDHHLRMSLEIHSIKDLRDSYQVYAKFSYKLLGTRKTNSALVRKAQENRIENAFQSQEFFNTKSELYSFLASTPLIIELWHSDKYSKDSLIGTVSVQMDQILRAPIKKTSDSILRVYDDWIDIINTEVIGRVRVLIYLEDLGVKKKGAVLGKTEHPEDYRAVLELEMWKRAEEAKWKASLKQKENEYIANLAVQWQENEQKREMSFQKLCNEVNALENKVRMKAIELNKREKALIKLEETKKIKIDETVRILAVKEEETLMTRSRFQEVAGKTGKESKNLESQLEKFKIELYQAEETLRLLRREQDFETLTKIKSEIEELTKKNTQYSKDIFAFNSQKESLIKNCESTREEFLKILLDYEEEKKMWEIREQEKISALMQELGGHCRHTD